MPRRSLGALGADRIAAAERGWDSLTEDQRAAFVLVGALAGKRGLRWMRRVQGGEERPLCQCPIESAADVPPRAFMGGAGLLGLTDGGIDWFWDVIGAADYHEWDTHWTLWFLCGGSA
jgi:hypothetical protein